MLRMSKSEIRALEKQYPGITAQIQRIEANDIPRCRRCGSADTALVQVGFVSRLMTIIAATSRVTLVLNGPKPGKYRCRACRTYFDDGLPWSKPRGRATPRSFAR